ncbi:hypothetical protein I309_02772 [Cryptococcus deuterogattii LA55]|nr:hypothetical protein I309_02772 [Cryptococcus deuterogattii LA55]KIR34914.1 hypothetical protein I352_02169 [Cryptococcus deuterogattii MMRL2647]KIR93950.1 hypothetical protein I304_02638 [Cryptococcus deuterogattii CBS 10090]
MIHSVSPPHGRPDLYRDILNIRYQPPLFAVSAGLLLRDDIHHAFDHLELSFYFQGRVVRNGRSGKQVSAQELSPLPYSPRQPY